MKKSVFSIITLIAMFILISVSCKTAPAPEPSPPPVEQPAPQVQEPAPPAEDTAGKAKAEEARKMAVDFESPAYFPSEWEAAEAQYAAGSYSAAADAYDEVFRKTVPLYAQAREDELMAVRDELVGTGFTNYFPDYLQNADELALAAMAQYEAENYYEARDTTAKALNEYETLLIGARVFLTRQEIVDRGFSKYDPDNFDKADEVTTAAMDEYEAGNKEAAVKNAEEAQLRYNLVLSNGWTAYAADRRNSAVSERELALAERANIAARDTFREAETLFNQAEDVFALEDYPNSAIIYTDAEAIYVIARHETEGKRLRAIESIRLAEEKIEESNETAIEAEKIIEGGSR